MEQVRKSLDSGAVVYPYEVWERAAIYEFDAGMSREKAEQKAIKEYEERLSEW